MYYFNYQDKTKKLIDSWTMSENQAKKEGFTESGDIEQSYDGSWYVKGYAPEKPEPTHEDITQIRASEYQAKVDPITAHISRLRDKEQTEEVIAEIAELISERDALVEQIKAEHPYPEEQGPEQTEEKE